MLCGSYIIGVVFFLSKHINIFLCTNNLLVTLQGDKNVIKFDGDHNSSRPQSFYDSVLIFFYNVLRPPQISSACSSKLESYYSLEDINGATGLDEVICIPWWGNPKKQSCVVVCYIFCILVLYKTNTLPRHTTRVTKEVA